MCLTGACAAAGGLPGSNLLTATFSGEISRLQGGEVRADLFGGSPPAAAHAPARYIKRLDVRFLVDHARTAGDLPSAARIEPSS